MKEPVAVVLSVLFVVAVAVPVFAADARQTALGSVGNYIEDDFNIFTWYGTLPSYGNTVWIGLDYDNDENMVGPLLPYMGASYGLGSEGKYGTLAMFFNRDGTAVNADCNGRDDNDRPFAGPAPGKWNVLYGYAMEKLSFGLFFSRSDWSEESEYSVLDTFIAGDPAVEYERLSKYDDISKLAYTTIGAGVRFDIGEKMYADLAFDFSLAGMTEKPDSARLDNASGYESIYDYNGYGEVTADANKMMNFRGRMFYEWNETITWVPFVGFSTFNLSLKGDSAKYFDQSTVTNRDSLGYNYGRARAGMAGILDWKDTHYGVKGMTAALGIGADIKVNENNLLFFAVEPFSYEKLEQSDAPADTFVRFDDYTWANATDAYSDPLSWGVKYERKRTVLPTFRLALESDVKDWLTFRVGAEQEFYKVEETISYKSRSNDGHDSPGEIRRVEKTETWTGSNFNYRMGLGFHVGDFDIDAVVNNNLPFRVGYWLTGYSNSEDGPPVYMLSAAYHF